MRFQVENMSCGHCVITITRALKALDPAAEIAVDLAGGTVTVKGRMEAAQAVVAMAEQDYPATLLADEPDESAGGDKASCCGTCRA